MDKLALILLVIGLYLLYATNKWRIYYWWYQNRPEICFQCRKIVRHKNTVVREHRVASWVRLCHECDKELMKYITGRR